MGHGSNFFVGQWVTSSDPFPALECSRRSARNGEITVFFNETNTVAYISIIMLKKLNHAKTCLSKSLSDSRDHTIESFINSTFPVSEKWKFGLNAVHAGSDGCLVKDDNAGLEGKTESNHLLKEPNDRKLQEINNRFLQVNRLYSDFDFICNMGVSE